MLDLDGLRAARRAAWNLLESELAQLHPLLEQMQTTGTVPRDWEIQKTAVGRAASSIRRCGHRIHGSSASTTGTLKVSKRKSVGERKARREGNRALLVMRPSYYPCPRLIRIALNGSNAP